MSGRYSSASVVIPTCNEGALLGETIEAVLAAGGTLPFEIVVVDDGSTDGSADRWRTPVSAAPVRVVDGGGRGVAGARNLGAAHAAGELLVFLDAHCSVEAGWIDRLAAAAAPADVALVTPTFTQLRDPGARGAGMGWVDRRLDTTWYEPVSGLDEPYEIPLACGACQAFPADAFAAVGRFDEGFGRWGFEDVEISLRAWLLGYRVLVEPLVTVGHWFRQTRGYDVDETQVVHGFLRLLRLHLSPERMARVLEAIGPHPALPRAEALLAASDVEQVRDALLAVRERDDAWFFATFLPGIGLGPECDVAVGLRSERAAVAG